MGRRPTKPPPTLVSEGQRMMLAVTGTLEAIATEVGVSERSTVLSWKDGSKRPQPAVRARIYAVFGIPPRAWDVPPGGAYVVDDAGTTRESDALSVRASAVPGLPTPSTLQDVRALLEIIRRESSASGLMPSERVKLVTAEAKILQLKATLEQRDELTEARYVAQHPAWLRARKLIVDALASHPLAAQAVLDALRKAAI